MCTMQVSSDLGLLGAQGTKGILRLDVSSSKAEQRISTLVSDAASCPRDFPSLLEQLRHHVST